MKVISVAVLAGSLCLDRPATAEIIYGPWTFTDAAFADIAMVLVGGELHVFPERAALAPTSSSSTRGSATTPASSPSVWRARRSASS